MTDIFEIETLILGLLLIVSIVAVIVRRFRIPYTVGLVLAGLALSFRPPIEIELTPELILAILLPPLVFEAAFHLNIDKLRRNVGTILLLAIPGVILTMLITGGIVSYGAGLPLGAALIFGALISATDPVSVVGIFRRIGAPKRLEVMLEGESLFNDGTAIVLFGIALGALGTGQFSVVQGAIDFLIIAGGGILVGLLLGVIAIPLLARIDDHLVETTLTTVLAFGSYLVAEELHVSGVLAVVIAGLIAGNIGRREMSPTTRIAVLNFWEYVAFLANSVIFLVIGLQVDLPALVEDWQPILWAIVAVLVSRAVGIYGLSRLGRSIPSNWRHVMWWGGLRGAIALALALSVPLSMGEERSTLLHMAFGVVLFTLLIQGLSMEGLVRRLGLVTQSEEQSDYEIRRARALAARSGHEHMQRMYSDGLISLHTWERMQPILRDRSEALAKAVQELLQSSPGLEADEVLSARKEELRAQRDILAKLRRDGVLTDVAFEHLVAEVDAAMELDPDVWPSGLLDFGTNARIEKLLMVVIQDRDLNSVATALTQRNIPSTIIKSTGGFLAQSNHTLLIGLVEEMLSVAVSAIKEAAKERVEFVSALPGTEPVPIAEAVTVQGATVFVFDVERYEAI
ncbi:MAG: Na+/H+ antiporter [Chloroflexi bacterium]|nr:Na+/H+ antiporter [Chloroflexota bacterium]